MLQAKPRWNLKQEMSRIFEALFFYRLLIWLWMCRERAYALCRSSKMSAALWRICRHIIGRLAIRDYICQGSARCPLSKLVRKLQLQAFCHGIQRGKHTSTNDISSKRYVKNTLRIDSKQRLPCFSRYYGVNLEKSLAFWWRNFRFVFGSQTWRTKRSGFSYTESFRKNWTFAI